MASKYYKKNTNQYQTNARAKKNWCQKEALNKVQIKDEMESPPTFVAFYLSSCSASKERICGAENPITGKVSWANLWPHRVSVWCGERGVAWQLWLLWLLWLAWRVRARAATLPWDFFAIQWAQRKKETAQMEKDRERNHKHYWKDGGGVQMKKRVTTLRLKPEDK